MPANNWPQATNLKLGRPARQAGWHRAGALSAVAALALGTYAVSGTSGHQRAEASALFDTGQPAVAARFVNAATSTDTDERADVAISQTMLVDPSQHGCEDTENPGIPAGCPVIGTLIVQNLGNQEATEVVVTDTLPENLLAVTVTPNAKCRIDSGELTCHLDPIPAGDSTKIVYRGTTAPSDNVRLTSVARVGAAGIDPDPSNNISMTSRSLNTSSDLSVSQTASTTLLVPGEEAHLSVTVYNYGPSDASNVRILASSADPLQAMISGISATDHDGSTLNCDPLPNDVNAASCVIPLLKVGETATATVTGRLRADLPDAGTQVDFDVNVSADTFDINPENNAARTEITSVAAGADLNLGVDEEPDPLYVGESAIWSWTVQNAGPSNATNAKVTFELPDNLSNVVITSDHGPCSATECDLGMMYASEDPMDPGNTAEVTVRGTPTTAGQYMLSATVSGDQTDPDPDNTATSTQMATIDDGTVEDQPAADLVISNFRITPVDEAYTGPGSQRRIQFTVTNNGPDVAETTWFRLTRTTDAAANLTGDLANNCMATSRELMCAIRSNSDLQPGESVNIDYTITLGSIARTGNYTDYVHVYSQTADPDETNNFAQDDIVIADSATKMALAMTPIGTVDNSGSPGDPASLLNPDGHPSFIAGSIFTYRVAVSVPEGLANASDVDVKVNLPAGFVPVSAVSGSGHCSFTVGDQPTAECLLPTVNAGSNGTTIINVSGRLKKSANDLYPNGDSWAEGVLADVTATSSTPDADGRPAQASASTAVDIIESADLQIGIEKDEEGAHPAGTEGYTIAVLNNGPSSVEHAAITAMLPLGVVMDESSDCPPATDLDVTGNGRLDVLPLADNFQVGSANAVVCAAAPNTGGTAEDLNAGQMGTVHLVVRGTPEALAKGFSVTAGSLAFDPDHANNVASTRDGALPITGMIPQPGLVK